MELDWFTLIAQIVNFIILVVLLKKLLYKPIVNAMQERENKIKEHLEEAKKKKGQANEIKAQYEQKQREIEEKRDDIMQEAKHDAEKRRKELVADAREEVKQLRRRWTTALQRDKENFQDTLRNYILKEVHNTVRRVTEDLADTHLEQQTLRVFLQRVEKIDEDEKEKFAAAVRESDGDVKVRSAFDLPEDSRDDLRDIIRKQVGNDVTLEFTTSSDLILGVEVGVKGHKIAWSLSDYLESLEARLDSLLVQAQKTERSKEEKPPEKDTGEKSEEKEKGEGEEDTSGTKQKESDAEHD